MNPIRPLELGNPMQARGTALFQGRGVSFVDEYKAKLEHLEILKVDLHTKTIYQY